MEITHKTLLIFMIIKLAYWDEAEDEIDAENMQPSYFEHVHTVGQAEEALARMGNFIKAHPVVEEKDGFDEAFDDLKRNQTL